MYGAHFHFREPPFSIAPDPDFLYPSESHSDALGHLLRGVRVWSSFVVLSGEIGTGKTTVVRSLLRQNQGDADFALIINPRLTEKEFIAAICDELRAPYTSGSPLAEMIEALERHLRMVHASGRRTVLVVDEAQNLGFAALQLLQRLAALADGRLRLFNLLLVGQPELLEHLAQPELGELASMMTACCRLAPFSELETARYIAHRLQVAGDGQAIFSESAMRRVHRHAQGIPRRINLACDHALLGAYTNGLSSVTPEIVDHASAEALGLARMPFRARNRRAWANLPFASIRQRFAHPGLAAAIGGAAVFAAAVFHTAPGGHVRPSSSPLPARSASVNPLIEAPPPAAAPRMDENQIQAAIAVRGQDERAAAGEDGGTTGKRSEAARAGAGAGARGHALPPLARGVPAPGIRQASARPDTPADPMQLRRQPLVPVVTLPAGRTGSGAINAMTAERGVDQPSGLSTPNGYSAPMVTIPLSDASKASSVISSR